MQQVSPVCGLLTVPVGYVLVGDSRRHVEHDDAALSINVISISQATELLLAGCVPYIELNLAQVLWNCQTSLKKNVFQAVADAYEPS